ncbi:MAG: CapA family protein, partial [Gemmatimonadota bacterium]
MDRRDFLIRAIGLPLGLRLAAAGVRPPADPVTLFLAGDVMTGRGIDQVLPHFGDPSLFEPYVRTATEYVELAERKSGPIPRPVDFTYIWGDALEELERVAPAARIVNLETSVTTSDDRWPRKQIHYRMHPANVPCLTAAGIDCCALANNHVLDWGSAGLLETLDTLQAAGIQTAGAGRDLEEAMRPAVLEAGIDQRVLVFGFGAASSGIPAAWAAGESRPGVNFLPDVSRRSLERVAESVHAVKRRG